MTLSRCGARLLRSCEESLFLEEAGTPGEATGACTDMRPVIFKDSSLHPMFCAAGIWNMRQLT